MGPLLRCTSRGVPPLRFFSHEYTHGGQLKMQCPRLGSSFVSVSRCAIGLKTPTRLPTYTVRMTCTRVHRVSWRTVKGGCERMKSMMVHSTSAVGNPETPYYSSLPLDRAGHLRGNSVVLEKFLSDKNTRVVLFVDGKALVCPHGSDSGRTFGQKQYDGENAQVASVDVAPVFIPVVSSPLDGYIASIKKDPGFVFLGMDTKDDVPVFACDLSSMPNVPGMEAVDVRKVSPQLCSEDAAVLALASGLLSWHRNTQFCSKTGEKASEIVLAGHGRKVETPPGGKTRRSIYPRIDPAVIVGAMHGDWLLLGRKATWAPGRYSLLAGFVECSETLEAAVLRETKEESGVILDLESVRYHSSQPWPFPQSLMVGFTAQTVVDDEMDGFELLSPNGQQAARTVGVLPEEINRYKAALTLPGVDVSEDELEDARWFNCAWIAQKLKSMNGRRSGCATMGNAVTEMHNFHIPGKHAIANRIIQDCIDRLDVTQNAARMPASSLDSIKIVDIPLEESSVFKYVLLRMSTSQNGSWESTLIVRGDPKAAYHNHIFTATKAELKRDGFEAHLDVLGGGRMEVDVVTSSVNIYGYSAAFGQAPHELTAAMLQTLLPFHSITSSYEGY